MAPSKQVSPTKVEATGKDQMAAKKLGAIMIVTQGNERWSRKVSMEEGDKIIKKITLYNKKPNETLKKSIVTLMTPEATKKKLEKEKKEVAVKSIKKRVQKEESKSKTSEAQQESKTFLDSLDEFLASDETAVEKIDQILAKYRKVEEKKPEPVPVATHSPRRGEH